MTDETTARDASLPVGHGGLVVAVDCSAPKDEQERQQAVNDELTGDAR